MSRFITRVTSLLGAFALVFSVGVPNALALDTSSTNFVNGLYYNNLISNTAFIATNSMTVNDIQNFLISKGSALATAPSSKLGTGANGRNAAQIIWDAAHGHGYATGTVKGVTVAYNTVSPKVLLVTLQKEMSLITLSTLSDTRLRIAMGYGCPDSGGCDSKYYGFTNQVERAAWQFRYNYEIAAKSSSWWVTYYGSSAIQYRVGNTVSLADGTGVYSVNFNNQATASLYRYTPHVFNGNYNFWKLYNIWFGSTGGTGSAGSGINDTSTISTKTYRIQYKISGTKTSTSTVKYGSTTVASAGSTKWSVTLTPTVGKKTYTISYIDGGSTVATKSITIDRRKPGDVNGDGKVELLDVSLMSDAWGQNVNDDAWLNLNPESDNVVDLLDLSILANSYGN
ncbi:hypothetical protein HY844_02295 [Candidatus Berkelbacteria bacterium]|nr:hypothetical protein [Candidatus Berkelbacteria bacterium]